MALPQSCPDTPRLMALGVAHGEDAAHYFCLSGSQLNVGHDAAENCRRTFSGRRIGFGGWRGGN
ncbi:MAG: hypothetical protein JSS27_07985 [Planctomycetes bacterium]|nr:hypothetical protein [Planctomycetota bacterium]